MTEARELTVRTWLATATSAGAKGYSRYFAGTLLPQLRELPGFAGAYLLRRADRSHVLGVTRGDPRLRRG
jgi:hypothetical protein